MKSRLNRAPADLAAEPIEGDSWLAVASGESTSVLDELLARKVSRHAPHARTRRSHPGPKVALAAPAHKAHLLTAEPTTAPHITTQHAAQPTTTASQTRHTTPPTRHTYSTTHATRRATLTLTAALLMAAATTAARRDTTSGCEDQRYIQRTSTEQPWHTQCTPKESPEHHHEHNHRTVRSN